MVEAREKFNHMVNTSLSIPEIDSAYANFKVVLNDYTEVRDGENNKSEVTIMTLPNNAAKESVFNWLAG